MLPRRLVLSFEDLEGSAWEDHQRASASRTGRTSTWEPGRKGHGTAQIDGEAALDAAEDGASTRSFRGIGLLETIPGGLAARHSRG